MQRLIIRHHPNVAGGDFIVQRIDARGGKSAPAVHVEDPLSLLLPGSDLRLGAELAWYLESYLDYPFGPNQRRAERVLVALRSWGQDAFATLLSDDLARDFYRDATRNGHRDLQLAIVSDEPRVLSWPWEALHDPQVGDLAQQCHIERQLDTVADPLPLPEGLSREQVSILLVTSRPYRDDIAYRSISRPLVELIHNECLPAKVKMLRPPSFKQLRRELEAHPGAYHIVHFDGHGGFGQSLSETRADHSRQFRGPLGKLVFENDDSSEDPISSEQLSQLLREHRIPIAVLNACQSAMINEQADDAFASVATALLRAGVRSVVAMGYSLYVGGAREFLPAFYRQLFRTGSVAEATRAGRQAMLLRPQRRGEIELQDWLVPVLYQQDPLPLDFTALAQSRDQTSDIDIPDAARVEAGQAPHGVIGRDSAVLAIERACRRAPAGLLLHGLCGVGKTTLVRGYIEWLGRTQGLPQKILWQSFADVRSFNFMRNRLIEELLGADAVALPDAQKWPMLLKTLCSHALLIVWDNFESASGTAEAEGAMPSGELQALKQFLEALRGGLTKILITSRSDEHWLGTIACYRLPLRGLQGEERQALAQAILADQGLRLDARDADTAELIDSLEGHPLMMRAILPRLGSTCARQLLKDIERYVPQADCVDPGERRLNATLRYIEEGLPSELRPLLVPIGLHQSYVDADSLAHIAERAHQPFSAEQTLQALVRLEAAGLMLSLGDKFFEIHPALTRYLRAQAGRLLPDPQQVAAWERGFFQCMAALANDYTSKTWHVCQPTFHRLTGNFDHALGISERAGDTESFCKLMLAGAHYAFNSHKLSLAATRYERLASCYKQQGREDLQAESFHQLGVVALARRDFKSAEAWSRKALEIFERLGDDNGKARVYHNLSIVATERRNFDSAEAWSRKALEIIKRGGNELSEANSYDQLGSVAQHRGDFNSAEDFYYKSLEIKERCDNRNRASISYQKLGSVAAARREFDSAEARFRKALEDCERLGDEHNAANSLYYLGSIALERCDLEAAEALYHKSLEIFERFDDDYRAAVTYNQLGILAQKRRDFDSAEAWSRKALEIFERMDDEHSAANSYFRLGDVALERCNLVAAEAAYSKALELFEHLRDDKNASYTYHQLGIVAEDKDDFDAAEAWFRKAQESFERLSDEYNAAVSLWHLGNAAQERCDLEAAEAAYRKALEIFERLGDEHGTSFAYNQLGVVVANRGDLDSAGACFRKALEIFERLGDEHGTSFAYNQLGVVVANRGDLDSAGACFRKALEIFERLGDLSNWAITHWYLGSTALERNDLEAAEASYSKALEIFKRLGDAPNASIIYNELGIVAEKRRDFDSSEACFRKAQEINERLGDAA